MAQKVDDTLITLNNDIKLTIFYNLKLGQEMSGESCTSTKQAGRQM